MSVYRKLNAHLLEVIQAVPQVTRKLSNRWFFIGLVVKLNDLLFGVVREGNCVLMQIEDCLWNFICQVVAALTVCLHLAQRLLVVLDMCDPLATLFVPERAKPS